MSSERIKVVVSTNEELVSIIRSLSPSDGPFYGPMGKDFPFNVEIPVSLYQRLYGHVGTNRRSNPLCEPAD